MQQQQQQQQPRANRAVSTSSVSSSTSDSRAERTEPLAFQQLSFPAAVAAVEIEMDIVDLFGSPLPTASSPTAEADFYFDFDRPTSAAQSGSSSSLSSTVTTPSVMADHTSPETDFETNPVHSNPSSVHKEKILTAWTDACQPETEEDLLQERRKRNRESMRRVRLRKRDAKLTTQQTVDELEMQLQQLMAKNQHAAITLVTHSDLALKSALTNGATDNPSYPELLSETASLSYENKHLRDTIKTHQAFEATMARLLDDKRLQQKVLSEDEALSDDAEILRPLLSWLTPADLSEVIALATLMIHENKALVESIVRRPNNALGWSDQRCVEGRMGRYLLQKTFVHETVERLAHKTWESIVDIDRLASVMRWVKGMKILHWLSEDAAVVTRELTIPNPIGSEFPTRFRFMLLVFRTRNHDGGWCIGTINLNIYGASVDECLQKDATHKNGLNAHTMYGWTFSRASEDLGGGCHVELAGLTGNGTHAYAHNVLMEMLTVVLLWEHATVASIRLLKT